MSDKPTMRQTLGATIGVSDLKISNDVSDVIDDQRQINFLEDLAKCGGEGRWDWSIVPPRMREMVADMIIAELVKEREYMNGFTVQRTTMVMTEKGRNVLETHRKRKITAGAVKAVEITPS